MTDQSQLTRHVVHGRDRDPHLPFGDGEFDGRDVRGVDPVRHPTRLRLSAKSAAC